MKSRRASPSSRRLWPRRARAPRAAARRRPPAARGGPRPLSPKNAPGRPAPGAPAAEPIVPTNGIRRAAPGGAAAEQALAEKARAGLQTKYGAGAPPSVAARLGGGARGARPGGGG